MKNSINNKLINKKLNEEIVIYDEEVGESLNEELQEDLDDEELEQGSNLSYIPEEEREVFIDRAQLSVFELHRRSARGDIILQPYYQRDLVWTRPKKSKLIESVLRNIPIPSIYFAETKEGKWEVVDGQQRLTAFFDFIDGSYSLSQLPVLVNMKNKSFKDLDNYHQRKIEDYQLHIFIIKKESHPDIRFDIFERINEGATQLNAQELRNSIYRGTRIDILKALSKNKNFIKLTKGKLQEKRLKHQEAILRFLSFYLKGYENYNGNLNSFLNSTLDNHLINKNNMHKLESVLDSTMKTIHDIFGRDAFIKSGAQIKRMNMSLFDIISYTFSKIDNEKIIRNKREIVNGLENLIENDSEFKRSINSNTLTKKNVKYRFKTWISVIQEITGDDTIDTTI